MVITAGWSYSGRFKMPDSSANSTKVFSQAVKLVIFDLAGTTVDDSISGVPLVAVAMKDAFTAHGLEITADDVTAVRGLEKKDAIGKILHSKKSRAETTVDEDNDSVTELVDKIFDSFKVSLDKHLFQVDREIPGTTETFRELKSRGVCVGVGSGFPQGVVESIVDRLGWSEYIDFVSSAEKEGHGRPNPALIHSAMQFCQVSEAGQVVKVGDTKADVEEGKNAGCVTVAVLTGTQSEQTLAAAKPDYIIPSVKEFPSLIQNLTKI